MNLDYLPQLQLLNNYFVKGSGEEEYPETNTDPEINSGQGSG